MNQGPEIITLLAAVSRKSHASISSYDQSSYDVASYVYRWNKGSVRFDVLQVYFFAQFDISLQTCDI